MDQATHNKIVSFIWGIADDVLHDRKIEPEYPTETWDDKAADLDFTRREAEA